MEIAQSGRSQRRKSRLVLPVIARYGGVKGTALPEIIGVAPIFLRLNTFWLSSPPTTTTPLLFKFWLSLVDPPRTQIMEARLVNLGEAEKVTIWGRPRKPAENFPKRKDPGLSQGTGYV